MQSILEILEIGSGTKEYNYCLKGDNITHFDIDKTAFHLELIGDCQRLPFKNNSFDVVYCGHVIEHLTHPYLAVCEFRRIARKQVIIKVPNGKIYKYWRECDQHIFSWEYQSLSRFLERIFGVGNVKVKTSVHYRYGIGWKHNLFVFLFMNYLKILYGDSQIIAYCRVKN